MFSIGLITSPITQQYVHKFVSLLLCLRSVTSQRRSYISPLTGNSVYFRLSSYDYFILDANAIPLLTCTVHKTICHHHDQPPTLSTKLPSEFLLATGRANIAFMCVSLSGLHRYENEYINRI